jgi:phosphoribosylaminoimidazole-succinocarboxamide synthase
MYETFLPGAKLLKRGKVRDVYDLGENLLIVATDRISVFDCVLPTAIPDKGRLLTEMSTFWFQRLAHLGLTHFVSTAPEALPAELLAAAPDIGGRATLARRARRYDFECVVRGYLAGSGWSEYQATGRVCGIDLPPGLPESARLDEPIFTPATKAEVGHDENVPFARMEEALGGATAARLRDWSLALYRTAHDYALQRGILIADSKFEFGQLDGEIMLIDEVFTPDSSRFWPADEYEPGRSQHAFDKQFVRDYLDGMDWDKRPPAPPLPPDIVAVTRDRYREARDRLLDGAAGP